MQRNLADNLSFYLYPDGRITALMPDTEPAFRLKFIRDFVGPHPDLVCFTPDGYALFRNAEAMQQSLPVNEVATAVCAEAKGPGEVILGRCFLVHPNHLDPALRNPRNN